MKLFPQFGYDGECFEYRDRTGDVSLCIDGLVDLFDLNEARPAWLGFAALLNQVPAAFRNDAYYGVILIDCVYTSGVSSIPYVLRRTLCALGLVDGDSFYFWMEQE